MSPIIEELNRRVSATGEEWAEDFADAQSEFGIWADKEGIPPEIGTNVNEAIRTKAVEVFNEAFAHCQDLLEQDITEEQAYHLITFMDSDLGLLLAKVYAIRERAYIPYHTYFQGIIPDIINTVADKWLEDNL